MPPSMQLSQDKSVEHILQLLEQEGNDMDPGATFQPPEQMPTVWDPAPDVQSVIQRLNSVPNPLSGAAPGADPSQALLQQGPQPNLDHPIAKQAASKTAPPAEPYPHVPHKWQGPPAPGKGPSAGAGVKALAQNNPVSCGQTAAAMCINAVTGKELTDYDINNKYNFNLLGALNAESNESGVFWRDAGDFSGDWSTIEKAVKDEGLPVMIGLGGKFASSSTGHIVTITGINGDRVTYADPNGGKVRSTTKQAILEAPGHSQGKFLFVPTRPEGKKTKKSTSPAKRVDTFAQGAEKEQLKAKVLRMAHEEGIDRTDIFTSLVGAESGFISSAISQVGAAGLTQMMPTTFEEVKKEKGEEGLTWEAFKADPNKQISYGLHYFKKMLGQFKDYPKAVAAYNMGPGGLQEALEGARSIPSETLHYVSKIFDLGSTKLAKELITSTDTPKEYLHRPGVKTPLQDTESPGFFGSIGRQLLGGSIASAENTIDILSGGYISPGIMSQVKGYLGIESFADYLSEDTQFGAGQTRRHQGKFMQGFTSHLGDISEALTGVPNPWRIAADKETEDLKLFVEAFYGDNPKNSVKVPSAADVLLGPIAGVLGAKYKPAKGDKSPKTLQDMHPLMKVAAIGIEGSIFEGIGNILPVTTGAAAYTAPTSTWFNNTFLSKWLANNGGKKVVSDYGSTLIKNVRLETQLAEAWGISKFLEQLSRNMNDDDMDWSTKFGSAVHVGVAEGSLAWALGAGTRLLGYGGMWSKSTLQGAKKVGLSLADDTLVKAAQREEGSVLGYVMEKMDSLMPEGSADRIVKYARDRVSAWDRAQYATKNAEAERYALAAKAYVDGTNAQNSYKTKARQHEAFMQATDQELATVSRVREGLETKKQAVETDLQKAQQHKEVLAEQDPEFRAIDSMTGTEDKLVKEIGQLEQQIRLRKAQQRGVAAQGDKGKARELQKNIAAMESALDQHRARLDSYREVFDELRKNHVPEAGPSPDAKRQLSRQLNAQILKKQRAVSEFTNRYGKQLEDATAVHKSLQQQRQAAELSKEFYEVQAQNAEQALATNKPVPGMTTEQEVEALANYMRVVQEWVDLPAGEASMRARYAYAKRAAEEGQRREFVSIGSGEPVPAMSPNTKANIYLANDVRPDQLRSVADTLEQFSDRFPDQLDFVNSLRETADTLQSGTQDAIKSLRAKELKLQAQERIKQGLMQAGVENMPATPGSRVKDWYAGPLGNPAEVPEIPISRMLKDPESEAYKNMMSESLLEITGRQEMNPSARRLEESGIAEAVTPEDKLVDQKMDDMLTLVQTDQGLKESVSENFRKLFSLAGDPFDGTFHSMKAVLDGHVAAGQNLAADLAKITKDSLTNAYQNYKIRLGKTTPSVNDGLESAATPVVRDLTYRDFERQIADALFEKNPAQIREFLKSMPEAREAIRPLLKMADLVESMKVLSPDLKGKDFIDSYFPVIYDRFEQIRELQGGKFTDESIAKYFEQLHSEKDRLFATPSDARKAYVKAMRAIGDMPFSDEFIDKGLKRGASQEVLRTKSKKWAEFITAPFEKQKEILRKNNPALEGLADTDLVSIINDTKKGLLVGEVVDTLPALVQAHVGRIFAGDARRSFLRAARRLDVPVGEGTVPMLGTADELGHYAPGEGSAHSIVEWEQGGKKQSGRYVSVGAETARKLELPIPDGKPVYMHPAMYNFLENNLKARDWFSKGKGTASENFRNFLREIKGMPLTGAASPFRNHILGRIGRFFNGDMMKVNTARELGRSLRVENSHLRYLAEMSSLKFNNWRRYAYNIADEMGGVIDEGWSKTKGFIDPDNKKFERLVRQEPELAKEWYELRNKLEDPNTPEYAANQKHKELTIKKQQQGGFLEAADEAVFGRLSRWANRLNSVDMYIQNRALFDDLNDIGVGAFWMLTDQLKHTKLPEMMAEGMSHAAGMQAIREMAADHINMKMGTVADAYKDPRIAAALNFTATPNYTYTRLRDAANVPNTLWNNVGKAIDRARGLTPKERKLFRLASQSHLHPKLRDLNQDMLMFDLFRGMSGALLTVTGLNYLLNGTTTASHGAGQEMKMNLNGFMFDLPFWGYEKMFMEGLGVLTAWRTSGMGEAMFINPNDVKAGTATYAPKSQSKAAGETGLVSISDPRFDELGEAFNRAVQVGYNQFVWISDFIDPMDSGKMIQDPGQAVKKNWGMLRDYGSVGAGITEAARFLAGENTTDNSMTNNVLRSLTANPNTGEARHLAEILVNVFGSNTRRYHGGSVERDVDAVRQGTKFVDKKNLEHLNSKMSYFAKQQAMIKNTYKPSNPIYQERMLQLYDDMEQWQKAMRDHTVPHPLGLEYSERMQSLIQDGADGAPHITRPIVSEKAMAEAHAKYFKGEEHFAKMLLKKMPAKFRHNAHKNYERQQSVKTNRRREP